MVDPFSNLLIGSGFVQGGLSQREMSNGSCAFLGSLRGRGFSTHGHLGARTRQFSSDEFDEVLTELFKIHNSRPLSLFCTFMSRTQENESIKKAPLRSMSSPALGNEFRDSFISDRFAIVQNPQRAKCAQQFVRFEQVQGMAGATLESTLFQRVGFVKQKPAGLERRNQSREERALKIEKDEDQIILVLAQICVGLQISYLGINHDRVIEARGDVLLGQLNADFRYVHQLYLPTALRQPQRMAPHAAGNVQGRSRGRAGHEFRIGVHQKWIRLQRAMRTFTVAAVPSGFLVLFHSALYLCKWWRHGKKRFTLRPLVVR